MTLKLRTKVNFPATVTAVGGLGIDKNNGVWTVEPRWEDLTLVKSLASPETKEVWSRDPVSNSYYRISVQAFIDTLPEGPKGDKGDAATIAVGTVTTLPAGSSATVTNAGTSAAAVFDFGIPKGADGTVAVSGSPTVNQFASWVDSTTIKGVSLTGLVKGNGASAPTAAVAGIDYLGPAAIGTTVQAYDAQLFSNIPQNSQSTTYTLVASDAQKHIYHPASDANARTYTIPANSSVAYPKGTAITFINRTSQVITIAINTDTMILAGTTTTGSRSLAQNGMATAVKVENSEWIISGTGLT